MKVLMTTDLHLNLKPDDYYRWDFLKQLPALIKRHGAEELYILGDLTHDKDKHPSELVNKIVDALTAISIRTPITILKGNHDYIDPDNPFMRFLNRMKNIHFIIHPMTLFDRMIFLPHSRNPLDDWKEVKFKRGCLVFMHQTVFGSIASNGMELDGELTKDVFAPCRYVFSGDIHVPQRLGNVTYIGTPYPIHFGDYFDPRLMVLDTETMKTKSIPYSKAPRKISCKIVNAEELDDIEVIRAGDYVKVEVGLRRADFPQWKEIRASIQKKLKDMAVVDRGVTIKELKRVKLLAKKESKTKLSSGMSDSGVVAEFSARESLGEELKEYGQELLL